MVINMADSGKDLTSKDMKFLLSELANKIYKKDPHNNYSFFIVGGAAMVMYYNCRNTSRDIDVFWFGNEKIIKHSIVEIANKYKLENTWINNDYEKSESFTKLITNNSIFFDRIKNVNFYIIRPELALCMKLTAFRERPGKFDRADAINIVNIMRANGIVVNTETTIDWLEYFYKPVPELRQSALDFIYGLGK